MRSNEARLDRLLRNFAYVSTWASRVPDAGPGPENGPRGGRSAAVVCWDLSHNPVGRAHVLTRLLAPDWNVELIGPIWPRFGTTLWEPLRKETLDWRPLHVRDLLDVWREGAMVALARRFDVVIVSKPRLPGLVIGLLLAEQSRCPLVLDFDEDEHAFVRHGQDDAAKAASGLLHEPFEAAGTALAAQHWSVADAVTVSSWHLQHRFGGHVVRHARDETASLASRTAARRRLGYAPGDLVLAFIGTARAHKGLAQVLAAMDTAVDPRLKLMVVGPVPDAGLRRALQDRTDVTLHPGCDFARLGEYLAAADLVPLLQDSSAPIAHSQFPAKLSDALQHGIPVVATETPPLAELAATGIIDFIAPDQLAAYLRQRLAMDAAPIRSAQIRRLFENEFSEAVNRVRLQAAMSEAMLRSNPFARTVPEALQGIAAAVRRARIAHGAEHRVARPAVLDRTRRYDVAFFWKQNDSDLFGRRSDMVTRYLLESGHVRRLVHFDRPINPTERRRMALARLDGGLDVQAMQFPTTITRALRFADEQELCRRVFLTSEDGSASTIGGQRTAPLIGLPDFVAESLREANCDPDRTVAWVCPTVTDFPAIATRIPFHRIVVDLIDDERSWTTSSERRAEIEARYAATLQLADLVLTNGPGNRARFEAFRPDIHVVPNGAEFDAPPPGTVAPDFLGRLRHPTIGYVGNLRDRIEWDLVLAVAERRPDFDIVLIGPWQAGDVPAAVHARPNVLLPGPLPYETARLCLRSFDCAIVPHSRNAVTDAMNPLKVYNFLAAGLPVVSTPIANLDDVRKMVQMAETADAFTAAIDAALTTARPAVQHAELEARLSWPARVATMLELLYETEERPTFTGPALAAAP